ncbi:FkbM family methyltransferase [Pirellulimonas nuda]|nr:FkbM family methyltransferase [Pirellulimonas nuda]
MDLDLSNWSDRLTFFLGRYYELDTQLALLAALRRGDTFIDVGANYGMLSLLAASIVGHGGKVHSIEPNPTCVNRLQATIEQNSLNSFVSIHPVAVGSNTGNLTLSVFDNHTGSGTLANVPLTDRSSVTAAIKVDVRRLPDIVDASESQSMVIKIDVEGLEMEVLRGSRDMLVENTPIIVLECVERHLQRAQSSQAEIASYLTDLGFQGFWLSTRRRGLRYHLSLVSVDSPMPDKACNNWLWIHKLDPRIERLPQVATPATSDN